MDLDLTGLDNLTNLGAGATDSGKPLELPLSEVIEDPDQPRQHFDEEKLRSLAEQIKAKKVKTPISVKPKNADGKYVINHGARRYRASIMAGKGTIPAFIDETHDDYDQAAENIQREGLTPMEIALFIHKRVKAGDKKGVIAGKLGQKPSFVSEYLPLIEAPAFIQELARTAKVGAKTLYLLIGAFKDFPSEVEKYAASTEEISRAGVLALLENLKMPAPQAPAPTPQVPAVQELTPPITMPGASAGEGTIAEPEKPQQSEQPITQPTKPVKPTAPAVAKPRALAILVKIDGRLARLTQTGKVQIAYKDSGETAEIELAAAEIIGTEDV